MSRVVRVYLVDDSAMSRALTRRLLESDTDIEVVGEADNGEKALVDIPTKNVDVVLMDVVMPRIDGLETTKSLMASTPKPVLIVSELVGRDAKLNFQALQAGALDLARKPTMSMMNDQRARQAFVRSVRRLAGVPVITRRNREVRVSGAPSVMPERTSKSTNPKGFQLVCVGASTGGPPALNQFLKDVGPNPPWPILLVQHISQGFGAGLGRWLTEATGVTVHSATHGMQIKSGHAYLAPDDQHMMFRNGSLILSDDPPIRGNKPAVDILFQSVAQSRLADKSIAVLLTGMGRDGADGMAYLHVKGAYTIAQDEASSVIFGMPKAAIDDGVVDSVLPIDRIGSHLLSMTMKMPI